MDRYTRALLAAALGVALAVATPAYAQQAKIYRVAFIATNSPLSTLTGSDPTNPAARVFVHRLRELGYVEGRNLILDVRTLEGRLDRSEELVGDIARLKPNVIFNASAFSAARSLKEAAGIPIVTHAGSAKQIIDLGLIKSLARPGGNVTGLLADVDASAEAKRLELLREITPKARRVIYLGAQVSWDSDPGKQVQAAAQRLGFSLSHVGTGSYAADYAAAFAQIERDRPDALFVPTGGPSYAHRREIGQFVVANRIPCISAQSVITEHGCLISYGMSTDRLMRRTAEYVVKILEGAKPADLPFEQPTTFELVINMKTARMLDIKVPRTIVLRADRVIE